MVGHECSGLEGLKRVARFCFADRMILFGSWRSYIEMVAVESSEVGRGSLVLIYTRIGWYGRIVSVLSGQVIAPAAFPSSFFGVAG
jgi:hypothetical protein